MEPMYDQNDIFALLMNEDGRKNVTHAFKNAGFVLPDKTQYDELFNKILQPHYSNHKMWQMICS